jgi:hypothetical protein
MRLCFGTFCTALLGSRKNNSVTQEKVCRTLFHMLDPYYADDKESSYFSLFANRQRELPASLKTSEPNRQDVTEQFKRLVTDCLTYDLGPLIQDLRYLIVSDGLLTADIKNRLLSLSEQAAIETFLAEVFLFIVMYIENTGVAAASGRQTQNLLEKIHETKSSVKLSNLAVLALRDGDEFALGLSISKISNEVYLGKALIAIAGQEHYDPAAEYDGLFHAFLSKMENHKYKNDVITACITTGYFSEHTDQLLALHLPEYKNQRYLSLIL